MAAFWMDLLDISYQSRVSYPRRFNELVKKYSQKLVILCGW